MVDGVILLEATNLNAGVRPELGSQSSPMQPAFLSSYSRPMGPMVINDAVLELGIPCTVVNYTDFWQTESLMDFIGSWLDKNNVTEGVFAISSLFSIEMALESGSRIQTLVERLRQVYPTFKIVAGGPALGYAMRPTEIWLPDAVFSSHNSVGLFQDYLLGKDIPTECINVHDNGVPEYRAPVGFSSRDVTLLNRPHVPILHDDYCLDSQDTLTFEIRKGCKFNCGFCSYEFRNAKDVLDVDQDELKNFFSEAVNKFGINTFMVADDTPNEEDIKLEILYDCVKDLDVSIGGFNRVDVMAKRPHQVDLCEKIGFHSHYFGIETMGNEKARKTIGKGGSKDAVLNLLQRIKTDYPHWYTYGGFMAGLPHDTPDDFFKGVDNLIQNNLIKGMLLNPIYMFDLDIWQDEPTMLNSNFQLNPEKYGFMPDTEHSLVNPDWSHYEVNSSKILTRLRGRAIKNGISHVLPFQLIMLKGLGWDGYQNKFTALLDSVHNPEPNESQIDKLRLEKIDRYIVSKSATV